jgi:hypothetical protein
MSTITMMGGGELASVFGYLFGSVEYEPIVFPNQ